MKSQIALTQPLSIPWTLEKDISVGIAKLRSVVSTWALKRLLSVLLILGLSFAGLDIKLSATSGGYKPTTLKGSYAWLAKPQQTSLASTIRPKSTTSAVATCNQGQPNTASKQFALCPSLSLNYTKMADGPIENSIFNVYEGAPEGNHEAHYYTASPANVQIEKGYLILRALSSQQQGYNYTSARVDTKGKADFLYGKLVVRTKLPSNVGAWPAIWMLPSTTKYEDLGSIDDPYRYLNGGEIDIAESVGAIPHLIYGIAHSLSHPTDGLQDYYSTITIPDSNTTFHDYGLEWTPTELTFTVDGNAFFSIEKEAGADYHSWPYDQPFYLVLNLALGGSWGGIDRTDFPLDGIDARALPSTMDIQSIQYYPYIAK
jgi:beta-glucanase (GH16 family)